MISRLSPSPPYSTGLLDQPDTADPRNKTVTLSNITTTIPKSEIPTSTKIAIHKFAQVLDREGWRSIDAVR